MRRDDPTCRKMQVWRRWLAFAVDEECAQGTLEYALTVAAVLSVVTAFALLWHAGQEGTLATLAERAASHLFDAGGLLDISLY